MKRPLLLAFAWLLLAGALYLPLLLLELYWNIISWRPTWDWRALLLLLWMAAVLLGFSTLARVNCHPTARISSLLICLSLFALGVYVTPAEPLSTGIFGRVASSPFWYRDARLFLMAVPLCMWCRTFKL